ncbi:MAG: hypothetical protein A2V83_06405 [Nitrospirae bacterium RBG_16_64_22]|nr:MAG: hypothetical protein A2V83_06405 [Nitrospirae bacterium RBG_16_64_22]
MTQQTVKKGQGKFTWQDYLAWPDDERWEVIDGRAYDMTPSPTTRHQRIVGNFFRILANRLSGGACAVFVAPLDVYFDDSNFVQPDVMVVCDKVKIRDRIHGAPDLIVEVLSPATSLKDKREKKSLYERFGVSEYVIVYPEEMFVERYFLADGRYGEADVLGVEDALPMRFLEGVEVSLREVFDANL